MQKFDKTLKDIFAVLIAEVILNYLGVYKRQASYGGLVCRNDVGIHALQMT